MPFSPAVDRPLVTMGSTVCQCMGQGRSQTSGMRRAGGEPGFMLIILNAPTVSHLLDSLIALVHSRQGSCHFFHLG